ncbi:hypothetical protein [Streptomyces sp. NPDC059008]|uniref:hypothetical protein n=1 Tax=Streptomyces sp. NPDC059008 TaxID=3346693 RepID=UPI0036840C6B
MPGGWCPSCRGRCRGRACGPVYSPERDTGPWIRFNLLAYHQQTQQAQRVRRRVDRSGDCWMQLMEAADSFGVTERQITALHEVAMVGRVRRSRYEKAEGINTQQATRELQALTKAGLHPDANLGAGVQLGHCIQCWIKCWTQGVSRVMALPPAA